VCCWAFTSHLTPLRRLHSRKHLLASDWPSCSLVEVKSQRATGPHLLAFHAHGVCCSVSLSLSLFARKDTKTASYPVQGRCSTTPTHRLTFPLVFHSTHIHTQQFFTDHGPQTTTPYNTPQHHTTPSARHAASIHRFRVHTPTH
jgi:hypothetical protein